MTGSVVECGEALFTRWLLGVGLEDLLSRRLRPPVFT